MFDVFAYIDPGTGSLFIQAVFGTLLAGMFMFRSVIAKVGMHFRRVVKREEAVVGAEVAED